MNKPNSYEEVMKELETVNDEIESGSSDYGTIHGGNYDFKSEYAFESLTERHSAYKRRNSNA